MENIMIKKSAVAVIALTAAFASAPVAAQSNFYGVASVGRSTIDVDPSAINTFTAASGLGGTVTQASGNDVGWKLQLGYQMTKSLALEGGYTSLGTAEYTQANALYTATGHKKADLFNLDLVGKVPLNQSFSALARLGAYRWETKSNLPTPAGMNSVTEDGYDWKFGAGAQYEFTPNFTLRGEFERFNGIGKQFTTGDSKVNLFSIGAVLKF
jgi:opacity protein-like surface antigen